MLPLFRNTDFACSIDFYGEGSSISQYGPNFKIGTDQAHAHHRTYSLEPGMKYYTKNQANT